MEFQDYYKLLGINKSASADEIKKQYRRMARKYHPDVSKEADAEEKFKQVKEAYEVLSDPEKRKAYDQFGKDWQHGQPFQQDPHWDFNARQQHSSQFNGEDYSDFFENLFGQRGQGFRSQQQQDFQQRGQDQHSKISISLQQAFHGGKTQVSLQEPTMMQNGQVRYETRTLNIKIPAGIENGKQIRLRGQGSAGFGGGTKGDLYIEVQIKPHKHFHVDGKNLTLQLPITPWEAACGAKITVPTLAGSVQMQIPAGSQSGNKLRLKGRGLPGKTPGDQFVVLRIETPKPMSEDDKALYEKMQQQMPFNPRVNLEQEINA